VHPSYGEPFGLSIVETMAMRKPVIACSMGGVPEIVAHGPLFTAPTGAVVAQRYANLIAAA
jgi:glycosyltransferase involved in cell wall biosynthesis